MQSIVDHPPQTGAPVWEPALQEVRPPGNGNMSIDTQIREHYRQNRREIGFSLLYKTYAGYVFTIAKGRVGSYQDAEEIRDDVLLQLEAQLVKELTLEAPESLQKWAARIASRQGISAYRKSKVRAFVTPGKKPVGVSGPEGGPEIQEEHHNPFHTADERTVLKQCLERLNAAVTPRAFQAFRLYHEGYTSAEIMHETGYGGGFQDAVENSHKRLRECLETETLFDRQRRPFTRAKRT